MNFIWRKESKKGNALYTDIIAMGGKDLFETISMIFPPSSAPKLIKSDETSLKKRTEGNALFAKGEWSEAMEKYNESLCFAPQQSSNISLAYANRSSCFLNMKLYAEALVDIENAKKTGYPKNMMPKLDQRKATCLQGIQKGDTKSDEPLTKLSYDPDERFPCVANVVKVVKDSAENYSMIAKEDIPIGKTVIVEKAFFSYLYQNFGWKCNICLKSNANLMPCKKCTVAMFCSNECQASRLHDYECSYVANHENDVQSRRLLREVRGILVAIEMFANIDELMQFVETSIKNRDPSDVSLNDAKSRYRTFLMHERCTKNLNEEDMAFCIAPQYALLMGMPQVKAMFKQKKHLRFLMHLIGYHSLMSPEQNRDEHYNIHNQVNLITYYMGHSCASNLVSVHTNGHLIYVTARNIEKGQQLFDSTKSRQRSCCFENNVVCKCRLCTGKAVLPTQAERNRMLTDPNFKFIHAWPNLIWNLYDDKKKFQLTMDKCVKFLKDYSHIEWCDEIDRAINIYQAFVRTRVG